MIRKLFSVFALSALCTTVIACSAAPDAGFEDESSEATTDTLSVAAPTTKTPPRTGTPEIVSNEGPQAKPCSCGSYPKPGMDCNSCDMIDWNGDGVSACTCFYSKKTAGGSTD